MPVTRQRDKEHWPTCTVGYYSEIKKNEIFICSKLGGARSYLVK